MISNHLVQLVVLSIAAWIVPVVAQLASPKAPRYAIVVVLVRPPELPVLQQTRDALQVMVQELALQQRQQREAHAEQGCEPAVEDIVPQPAGADPVERVAEESNKPLGDQDLRSQVEVAEMGVELGEVQIEKSVELVHPQL